MPRTVSRVALPTRGGDLTVVSIAAPIDRRKPPGRAPVVVLTANVHGDECTGVGAILRLIPLLEASLLRGTVHLYPSLNPEGLERRSRKVPEDDQDLNRLFPGDAAGSPAERVAWAAWSDLQARQPDLVIDLHSDAPGSLPYVLLDRAVRLRGAARTDVESLAASFAEASGLTVLQEYPDDRYERYRLDRSLTGALLNASRTPALTVECGPRLHLDEPSVSTMMGAVLGMLQVLGMVDNAPGRHPSRVDGAWRRDSGPRASASGILFARTRPGQVLQRGEIVAEVRSMFGTSIEELPAEHPGFVVSPTERTHVVAGVPACTYAIKV